MNAVAEQRVAVTVALLGPADAARQQLRQALQAFGADLIFEGELAEAGALAGNAAAPDVLIVNLEPGVEDELDSIQELLDHPHTSVVFNEGEVSSQLTGWDLARWARHLSAKVLGVRDTLPPAPSGAERLPLLDLVPEPGRPESPAQQQDHLQFDTFADEVFERQDDVPSSPRLDQLPAMEASLEFDFSPVAGADDDIEAAADEAAVAPDEDRLDDMDLSAIFEQGFEQLTPEDMLARLQMAMGLDPIMLPEDVPSVAASSDRGDPEPDHSTAVAERGAVQSEGRAERREPSSTMSDSADASAGTTLDSDTGQELSGTADQDNELELATFDFDFESVASEDDSALAGGPIVSSPAPAQRADMDAIGAFVDENSPQPPPASPESGFNFDPVSAEFDGGSELDDTAAAERMKAAEPAQAAATDLDAELVEFDFELAVGDAADGSEDSDVVTAGFQLEGDEESLTADQGAPAKQSGSQSFDLQDASLGGTLTLEPGADDDEIERMAAALDAQQLNAPPRDLPELEFDFSRPRFDIEEDGAAPGPVLGSSEATAPRQPLTGKTAESAQIRPSFGDLALTPMGDEFIDPQVAAPLAEPPKVNFDFSALSLSLEPLEESSGDGSAPEVLLAQDGSSVATMRDGAWMRDIGEEMPSPVQELPAAAPSSQSNETLPAVHVAPLPSVAPPLNEGVSRVIVLCASIGGPDALRSFLAGIPPGFPAVFVVVQHLESGYFERLAQQLQKASKLPVKVPVSGQTTRDGEVLVVSADNRFLLSVAGEVELTEKQSSSRYHPCIDDVLGDVSAAFSANATAIIFSGMAADAIEGAVGLTEQGGEVWVQDPESCVVSSMVDGARARGVVEFIGSPRELAEHCVRRFGG